MGQIFGSFLLTWLLAAIVDRLFLRRTRIELMSRVALASSLAAIIAIIIYGFGNADGGPWNPGDGVLAYIIGAGLSGGLRFYLLQKKVDEEE